MKIKIDFGFAGLFFRFTTLNQVVLNGWNLDFI